MYHAFVFIRGKWKPINIGFGADSFRIPHYTTRKYFHHGPVLHMGQVHSALRWARKRNLPFKYVKVQ